MKLISTLLLLPLTTHAFVPFIDGGKGMPKLYDAWFNEQICKQASTAIGKAIAAGNVRIITCHNMENCEKKDLEFNSLG